MSESIPSLYVQYTDNRDNINKIINFNACVKGKLMQYNSSAALKKLLESEDIDSICSDEITSLKGISSSISVKETRSIYPNLRDFDKSIYE